MPASPAPSASGVRLFIEGGRFEALTFSSAGVTVPHTVLDVHPEMRRGGPYPATLQIGGEMFGVILRLASKREGRVELAFVSLAPQARRALEREAAATPPPRVLDLAFERLVQALVPGGRRVALPESAGVHALTLARRVTGARSAVPPALAETALGPVSGRTLMVGVAGVLGLLTLCLWALV